MNMAFIKALAKSKTIRGIVGAAIAFLSTNVIPYIPVEVLGQYGPIINIALQALGIGALGYAVNGRAKAAGPLMPGPESGVRGRGFDGTSGETPK